MSVPDTEELDDEDVNQVAEAVEKADEDVTSGMRTRAFYILVAYVVTIFGGGAALIWFGYLTPDILLIGKVNIGWILEYFIAGIAAFVLALPVVALLIWAPGTFWGALTRAFGYAAVGFNEQNSDDSK